MASQPGTFRMMGLTFCGARAGDGTTGGHYREDFFAVTPGLVRPVLACGTTGPGSAAAGTRGRRPMAASWAAGTTRPTATSQPDAIP